MIEKNIGYNNGNALQSIDYTYNARNWLTGINNLHAYQNDKPLLNCNTESAFNNAYQGLGNVGGDPVAQGNDQNPDLFSQTLTYGNPITAMPGSAPPQYNGNISQTMWQVAGREAQGYAFQYDDLNRLTNATSSDFHSLEGQNGGLWQSNPYSTDNKYKESLAYDVRGNITSLQRNGLLSEGLTVNGIFCGNFGAIDNLGYTYNSKNQIRNITDVTGSDKGFIKKSTSSDAYEYDSNGNLKKDLNKGITEITYNHLNLPLRITFNRTYPTAYDNGYIEFMYDAAGNKLRKSTYLTNGTLVDKRDYLSGWIEYNKLNQPELIHNEEGMMRKQANGTWLQEYFLKDHLGNTRVTFTDADNNGTITDVVADIKQINSYYPFGLNMDGNFNGAGGNNKYAYNGKEWNDDFGLGMNDYGARFYDPAVARWSVIDPMAERYTNLSPYNYVSNNPIIYIDPDGMQIIDAEGIVQTQKNLLDKNKGAVDEALKMAGLSEDMSKKLKDYKSSLNDQLDEIKTLEKSDQVYNVSYEGDATAGGATSYNEKTKAIDIQIGKGKSEIDESGVISHELKHGHQYENGQLSLKVKNDGYGSLYDISDEVGAYNNQSVLEYGSFYQSNSWDEKKVRSFGKGMIPSAYQDLPSGPTNINSKEGKALRERTKQAGANGSAVEEVYKGWEKDYQKGKK